MNVLLVDDDPSNLLALKGILRKIKELNPVIANSGEEALEHITTMNFAVIILDVNMPKGLSGFETLEQIRKIEKAKNTPVILLTASVLDSDSISKGYFKGAVDYLIKSSPPEILIAKVQFFMEMEKNREELKVLNERLTAHASELLASNNDLEAFNHMLAHDLRNQLQTINSYSEFIQEEVQSKLSEQGKRYFGILQNSGWRMNELMNDLLRFSKINSDPIEKRPVNLSKLASIIISTFKKENPNRNIEISITDSMTTEGDFGLLKIALENLLGNAWKYTEKNPMASIVFSKMEKENGESVFFVRDNGAGFDMKNINILFTPFKRLHSSSDFKGTGLGLVTIQKIILRHNGTIWAEAEKEKGATFYFTIK